MAALVNSTRRLSLMALAEAETSCVSDSVKGTHPDEWCDNRKVTHPGCSGIS